MTQQMARRAPDTAVAQQQDRGLTLEMVCEMTGYTPLQMALVSKTVANGAPLLELAQFLHACKTLNLDPLLRQAYWIRRKSRQQVDGEWLDVYKGALQVGIDGFRALADRQGNYAGSQPPEFRDHRELTFEKGRGNDKQTVTILVPGLARVTCWKIVQGRSCAFTGEARWDEFYPGAGPNGEMWRKMPNHQLAKCAEAQALRKGWPALLGSLDVNPLLGDVDDASDGGLPETEIREQPMRPQRTAADYQRIIGSNYDDESARAPAHEDAARKITAASDPLWKRWQATVKEAHAASIEVPPVDLGISAEALETSIADLSESIRDAQPEQATL